MSRLLRAGAALVLSLATQCSSSDGGMQAGPIGAAAGAGGGGGTAVTAAGQGGGAPQPAAGSGTGTAGQAGAAPSGSGGMSGASAGDAGSQSDAGPGSGGADAADAAAGEDAAPPTGPRFPSVDDLAGDGPYTARTMTGSGPGGGYSLFYPEELAPDGIKNPFLTWGNGATTTPGLYELLPHLASHGFVVIASDNAFVTGEEMRAGIDWLFAENDREGSPFYQKLDTANVASMGYSLGSLGTFEIADDPRLVTTVHISGGAMDKAVVPNLKHPAAFFCGDPSDIAHDNCESDFELAMVPVFYGVFAGDHLGILASHAEQIGEAVTGWLRWRLMHDDSLASMFVGADCTLCSDARWDVKQKDFDVAP